jgi:hypothetical protein
MSISNLSGVSLPSEISSKILVEEIEEEEDDDDDDDDDDDGDVDDDDEEDEDVDDVNDDKDEDDADDDEEDEVKEDNEEDNDDDNEGINSDILDMVFGTNISIFFRGINGVNAFFLNKSDNLISACCVALFRDLSV